ncbi:MAG: radical SAM family heme chaperone HemW [Verrucomicrobia bacterium]|nr:radical SAM family heme chaperone HemW [Verrucomicrobiota bacterium]
MRSEPAEPIQHLYVHVPFCARKCEYCAFYSAPASAAVQDRYIRAVSCELGRLAGDLQPLTVYFGGGTPSLLSVGQWEQLFSAMDRTGWRAPEEWTIECNPGTVSAKKAELWRGRGVNRISLGIQSLEDELLERLGRVHRREEVFRAYDCLRRVGFDNVGVDLMFAIPGQTLAMWRRTLAEALALEPEHLSCYEVTYEEDTPLFAQLEAGALAVDEDLACEMFEELVRAAADRGLEQYEIANFARRRPGSASGVPDWACWHNINYWRGGGFYGLGPSATGYVRGVRTRNWADTTRYCELIEQGRPAIESSETLPPLARAGEIAAFGLRMNQGWGYEEFTRATGYDLRREWLGELRRLADEGLGVVGSGTFRLTARGLRLADRVGAEFLRP